MDTTPVLLVSPTRIAMTVGAVTATLMLLASTIGWQIVGWLIFAGGIWSGMRLFRNEHGGILTYFKALNAGVQTSFFASLILAFIGYITTTFEPSLITAMLDTVEQQLNANSIPEGLAEMAMQQWRNILSPVVFAVIIIFMYTVMGCLASIVCALFIQNAKPKEFVDY